MALLDRLPTRVLTVRGWAFLLTAVVALLFAQVLGRRDLLYVGVLFLALPLASLLVLRLVKPRFRVDRAFSPQSLEIGATTTVTLALTASVAGGANIAMTEQLPARFGTAPRFSYPSRNPTRDGVSRYEYRLRSSSRGVYAIGPVTAEFTDPFGLCTSRHVLGTADPLVVTPAPVDLLPSSLAGSRGSDGMAATRRQANPSDDDVMTREYRHGDSMRRVHWAATARHSELMVRQEESVTTPSATLVLDTRTAAFQGAFTGAFGLPSGTADGGTLASSPTFEWAVTAAMSVSAHLLERNYALRFLDQQGAPALQRSPSAPYPDEEEHQGPGAVAAIAEGLAALGLAPDTGRHPAGEDRARSAGSTAVRGGEVVRNAARRIRRSATESPQHPSHTAFGDDFLDKLSAPGHRGPLVLLLGTLTIEEARALASTADTGAACYAVLAVERPADSRTQLQILRDAGWHATAASPKARLATVWAGIEHPPGPDSDAPDPYVASTRRPSAVRTSSSASPSASSSARASSPGPV